jgi:hypothetical protein
MFLNNSITLRLWGDLFQRIFESQSTEGGRVQDDRMWYSGSFSSEGMNELRPEHIEIFTQIISKGKL